MVNENLQNEATGKKKGRLIWTDVFHGSHKYVYLFFILCSFQLPFFFSGVLMYIELASVNVLYVKSVFLFFIVLMYIELASINVLYV